MNQDSRNSEVLSKPGRLSFFFYDHQDWGYPPTKFKTIWLDNCKLYQGLISFFLIDFKILKAMLFN